MTKRFATALLVLVLGLGHTPAVADTTIDAQTNQARAAAGLAALPTRAELTALATIRVNQVVTNFAHPSSYQWMFDYIPGCEAVLGENIAWHTAPPVGWPVSAWMASASHKANILGNWTWQGSAMLVTGGRTYAVQLFARACGTQPPAPAPAPGPIVDVLTDTSMTP